MRGLILLFVLVVVLAFTPALQAAPDYEFYKGKTLSYIITTKPGGAMTPMGDSLASTYRNIFPEQP